MAAILRFPERRGCFNLAGFLEECREEQVSCLEAVAKGKLIPAGQRKVEVDITLEYRAYRDRKEVCSGYCLLGKQSYDINDRHFSQALQLTPLADPLQRFKEQAPGLAEYCAQQGLETRVVLGSPFCIRESCLAEAYPQEAPGKKTAEIPYFFRNRPRR